MAEAIGRGWLGSLRKRVDAEVGELARGNRALRRARYGWPRRLVRGCVAGRSLGWFAALYLVVDCLLVLAEVVLTCHWPQLLRGWTAPELVGRLKDVSGFLITAQVGLLAIVSVAVGIVSLISQSDDGSSTNANIRLYYTESLAYEVVSSSAALLLVLGLQLFWPLQFLIHQAGYGGSDQIFKVALTVVHVLWLALNTVLFGQFLIVTLRFVEPSARARMREHFTANIIAPDNNRERLIRYFYMTAPRTLFPNEKPTDSPYITFGYGWIEDQGQIEITTDFKEPSRLHDVWMRPLGLVLEHWVARTRAMPPGDGPRNVIGRRLIRLVLRPDFDVTYEGEEGWCVRVGGAPLRWWERAVIRLCFRFRPKSNKAIELPTPTSLLEELQDKVVAQIDKLAETRFRAALDEATSYHSFLLQIHETRDPEGRPMSFAQIGGIFQAPFQEWVRQYRRVLEKAIAKLETDNYFINALSHVAISLLPRDAGNSAAPLVTSLLDIGVHEIALLEAWFTRHLVTVNPDGAGEQHVLPGSTQGAYEAVVLEFVGAWESLIKSTSAIYDWSWAKREGVESYWAALIASWPYMFKHLTNSAYYLALAVWNEDSIGATRYRDILVRWLDSFRLDTQGEYVTRHKGLLGTDLHGLSLGDARTRLRRFMRYDNAPDLGPEAILGLTVRNAHSDAMLATAAVILRWQMQDMSALSAEVARALVMRQALAGAGDRLAEPLPPPDHYSAVWGLFLRCAAAVRADGESHHAEIDGLVRQLSQMAERRMISGRIYSSVGWDGLESLYPQLLAMLTALLPGDAEARTVGWFREFAEEPELFADGDDALRRLIFGLQSLQRTLAASRDAEPFRHGVAAIAAGTDAAAASARLTTIIDGAITAIDEVRTRRLRDAPLDQAKVEAFRRKLENVIAGNGIILSCFRGYGQERSDRPTDGELLLNLNGVDKADYITPSMSVDRNSGFEDLVTKNFAESMGNMVWRSLWARPWTNIRIDAVPGSPAYWDVVIAQAERAGPNPAALVPAEVGNRVIGWCYAQQAEAPPGRTVRQRPDRNGGLGAGYAGTIDDVDVFISLGLVANETRVISSSLLETVVYHPFADGRYVTIDFEQGADPRQSMMRIHYSLRAVWHRHEAFRVLSGGWDGVIPPPPGPGEGQAAPEDEDGHQVIPDEG